MKKLIEENVQYINNYKNIYEWQKIKNKNLKDEISRLNTNLEGLNTVLQESTKEYMNEIVCKTDQINELKNKIEQQEIMIDKIKNCYNCGNNGKCIEVECETNIMNKWKPKGE